MVTLMELELWLIWLLYSLAGFDFDSDSDDSVADQPKKKKRIRTNRRLHPFPRIVKRDIRRMYPAMLANVMNSGDLSLLSDFLVEFAVKKCRYTDYFPGSDTVNLSWNRSFEGVPAVMKYFASYWTPAAQALIPDFNVKVRWAAVKQFLNKEHSELTCGLTFSATPIFDVDALLATVTPRSKRAMRASSDERGGLFKRRKAPLDAPTRRYEHKQTLYLTPDVDDEPEEGSSAFPLLSTESGLQLVKTAQALFQSNASSKSIGEDQKGGAALSGLLSFLTSPTTTISYDGMVTFRLDEKCRIRSLEFGPEMQRSSTSTTFLAVNPTAPAFIGSSSPSTCFESTSTAFSTDSFGSSSPSSEIYDSLDQDYLQMWDGLLDQSFVSHIPV